MYGFLDSSRVCGSWKLYIYEGQSTPRWSIVDAYQHGWLYNNLQVHRYDLQKLNNSTQKLQVCKGYEAIS